MSEKKKPKAMRPVIDLPKGYELVLRGETWDIEPPAGADLQDLETLKTLTDLRRELEIAVAGEPHLDPGKHSADHDPLPQPPEDFRPWESLDLEWVLSRMARNVTGDAELFAAMHQGHIAFNLSTGGDRKVVETLVFLRDKKGEGLHWEQDEAGSYAHNQVESVAKAYEHAHRIRVAQPLKQRIAELNTKLAGVEEAEDKTRLQGEIESAQKALDTKSASVARRCAGIRSPARENQILTKCTSVDGFRMSCRSLWLDADPWLLPVGNGVIDLRTCRFRPGLPDDWMVRASKIPWEGAGADREPWERFLREVYADPETGQPRDDLIEFMHRLYGYSLLGTVPEHRLPILLGRGRNGKSLTLNVLRAVLGPLAGTIPAELLLDQGVPRGADSPTPSVMSLKGLRLAWASEVADGRKFSIDRVQWLTGGDELTGRHPNDKYPITFKPTHKLMLLTNNLPQAPATAYAFWERVLAIPHMISFVSRAPREKWEKPADPNRINDLLGCLPGILAWLVEGFAAYARYGLKPPAIVTEATDKYREGEDALGEFIAECCETGDHYSDSSSALYNLFVKWWHVNMGKHEPSQRKFGRMLSDRGFERGKSGVIKYRGLRAREGALEEYPDRD